MLTAYCDCTGKIRYGSGSSSFGAFPLASHTDDAFLKATIEGIARRLNDNRTLVVPGFPEAGTPEARLDALIAFGERVRDRFAEDRN